MLLPTNHIIHGDALTVLKTFPDACIDCVVSSPPYWSLRDYGVEGQLGLEPTFQEYISKLATIFDEVKRVLKPTGTCWVVLGDTYGGSWGNYGARTANQRTRKAERWERKGAMPQRMKPPTADLPEKCLLQIPARFAIEMTNRGWTLRNQIVWKKPNGMPSSVKDRLTVDYEFVFFFVKSTRYFFDMDAIREPYHSTSLSRLQRAVGPTHKHFQGAPGQTPQGLHHPRVGRTMALHPKGRNKRCVWTIATQPFRDAHFAVYPQALIEIPIKAGCPPGGIVLDPFLGSGTTAIVARALERRYIGIEIHPDYIAIAKRRLQQGVLWAASPGGV